MKIGNYTDVSTFLNRTLEIKQNATRNACKDDNNATALSNIRYCRVKLRNYTDVSTL